MNSYGMNITQSVDITHKPKRFQNEVEEKPTPTVINKRLVEVDISNSVPQYVTLEQAITYFSSHATGDFKALYARTADWLTELRELQKTEKPKEDDTDGEQNTEIGDISEGEKTENGESGEDNGEEPVL